MAAHAVKTAVAQHAQQACLQLKRHVTNFIEEQSAAIGLLKTPAALALRAGESTALVAEQFAFEQLLRYGGGVDGHKRSACAGRMLVQGARHQLLTGAGFASHQDRDMALAQTPDGAEHVLHRGRLTHHFRRIGTRGVGDFFAQAFLHRAANQFDGFGQIKGFGQVLKCTALKGADGAVQVRERGHDDNGQAGVACLDFFQ